MKLWCVQTMKVRHLDSLSLPEVVSVSGQMFHGNSAHVTRMGQVTSLELEGGGWLQGISGCCLIFFFGSARRERCYKHKPPPRYVSSGARAFADRKMENHLEEKSYGLRTTFFQTEVTPYLRVGLSVCLCICLSSFSLSHFKCLSIIDNPIKITATEDRHKDKRDAERQNGSKWTHIDT